MSASITQIAQKIDWLRSPKIFFWIYSVLILCVHVLVFRYMNMVYIDSDQPNLWLAATDFSEGKFYEPRYYGQAYNTNMEALFAVPFLWLNIPVYYAVPIATHLIFLFPIFFIAIYLYKKNKPWNAALVLGLSLCFPLASDILVSLPRGFVTGTFFTGFFVTSIHNPLNLKLIFINTVLAVLACFVNPNSLLVSVPFLFYLFLCNYSVPNYYIVSFVACFFYVPFYFIFDRFYVLHPDVSVHHLRIDAKAEYFFMSFNDLDIRFSSISPFVYNNCIPLLFSFLILGAVFFRWDKKIFGAYLVFLLAILISFFFSKTMDGIDWVYMSRSRMYLGIPPVFYLFLGVKVIQPGKGILALILVPLLFTASKFINIREAVAKLVRVHTLHQVLSVTLEESLRDFDVYKRASASNGINTLFVSNGYWMHCVLSYGAPAVHKNYPRIEMLENDRRYWIRNYGRSKVFNNFLLLSGRHDLEKLITPEDSFQVKDVDGYGLYIVTHNKLNKLAFSEKFLEVEKRNTISE